MIDITENVIDFILGIALIILFICLFVGIGVLVYDGLHTTYKDETIVVEVQDKHTELESYPMMIGKVMTIQHRTEYYLDTDEESIKVNSTVYDEHEIGQKITVTRRDKYKIEDGKEVYISTSYEWE